MLIDVSSPYLTRTAHGPLLVEDIASDMSAQDELRFGTGRYAQFAVTKDIPLEAWVGINDPTYLTPMDAYTLGQTQALIVFAFCPEYKDTFEVHLYNDEQEARSAWLTYVVCHQLEAVNVNCQS